MFLLPNFRYPLFFPSYFLAGEFCAYISGAFAYGFEAVYVFSPRVII